jgi:hypothetical protein
MQPGPIIGASRCRLLPVGCFGRTMAAHLQMLALDQDALRGLSVLDVTVGPGSIAAGSLARGRAVTDCDPLYDGGQR